MKTNIRIENNIPYLGVHRAEKLDLYIPEGAEALKPAMVVIHGGGWFSQSKEGKRERSICIDLAEAGYVCASIDYLLLDLEKPETAPGVWPANVKDCKRAVGFLRENAGHYGIEPQRIGVIGGSAGAHLAAMLGCTQKEDGFDPDSRDIYTVQAVVFLYGIGDLARWPSHNKEYRKGMAAAALMLGGDVEKAPDKHRRASPVHYASEKSAPILIVHGTRDAAVSFRESEHFHRELLRLGTCSELLIVPDAPHSFDLRPPQMDLRHTVLDFLERSLRFSQ